MLCAGDTKAVASDENKESGGWFVRGGVLPLLSVRKSLPLFFVVGASTLKPLNGVCRRRNADGNSGAP